MPCPKICARLAGVLAGLLPAAVAPAQFLIVPDSSSGSLVSLSVADGNVIDPALVPAPNATQFSAIDVGGEIWVSDQFGDVIRRLDLAGNLLGTIGPTFPNGGGLDNVRGMAFVAGLVYATNAGGNNGATPDSIVAFDTAGTHVLTRSLANTSASPFAILPWQGGLLVSGSVNAEDVHRYDLLGNPLGTFHDSPQVSFAEQMAPASDGNVWLATFSTDIVCKLDATTGAVLASFPADGARGVFELRNGKVLWTNSSGVHVRDLATATSTTVHVGSCYHVGVYGIDTPIARAVPVGVGCDGLSMTSVGWPRLGTGFGLVLHNLPAVSPIGFFAWGTGELAPGLDLTWLGMNGCFAYTNLDLGLVGGGANPGSTSLFSLPIPADPALSGARVAAQGVALSTATAFGLATSNGMRLVLGN